MDDRYKDCDKQHQLLEWVEQFEQLFLGELHAVVLYNFNGNKFGQF